MTRQTNVTEADLVQFLSSLTGYPVDEKTIFFDDPGLAGLEAETFMIEFSEKYHVDLSDFDPSSYYTAENDLLNPFKPLYPWLLKGKSVGDKTFTVSHLLKVIQLGVWIDS